MPLKMKQLEMMLQKVPPHPNPDPALEQYMTPAPIAARVLYDAHANGDIEGRSVADLGCGTGILAIGAKLLGAAETVGIDVDEVAIDIAHRVAGERGLEIDFMVCEIGDFDENADTVIMNPPFGCQKKHADMPFLEKAMAVSKVVYSMHMAETRGHVEKAAKALNGTITFERPIEFEIRHMFGFHRKEVRKVDVVLLRIERDP